MKRIAWLDPLCAVALLLSACTSTGKATDVEGVVGGTGKCALSSAMRVNWQALGLREK
jgi:hypothetical protein